MSSDTKIGQYVPAPLESAGPTTRSVVALAMDEGQALAIADPYDGGDMKIYEIYRGLTIPLPSGWT